jgi:eukaryotic-like serine/threonine-protein kinase
MTPGTRLGPYEILAPIGAGGMGEVYKARDTRLDRIVALKISRREFTERFDREARAVAALNHPHICQLYDVGPNYLVMEYIDGTPLKGPLAPEETVRLSIQIADALIEAHAVGILHRDLKPGNILVTAKGAKLVDFGLAKQTNDTDATWDMAVVGTPGYMAPEQAEGKPLDHRTDIFSFGAVLYEMLSGDRPFRSIAAVLNEEPAPLRGLPAEVALRCLRKSPAQRFQTMHEVKGALQRIAARPAERQPSIAVLPFANMSRDADEEYFSDGLSEEIINALAQIPGLKVTARTSAFAFRGKEQDIRKIAEALDVRTILEGSVRRAGNRVRVTAQLIDAQDGYHLWSQRYDRELADVFEVQDEIAAAIAKALEVKLTPRPAAAERYKPSLPAYEAYLRGRHQQFKVTPRSMELARECYEQAIALDPKFALAYAELAGLFNQAVLMGMRSPQENVPRMREYASKALELDPSLPDAHTHLGMAAAIFDLDWKEAERRFAMALAHPTFSPLCRFLYRGYLLALRRPLEAVEQVRRAVEEDPLNSTFRAHLAFSLWTAGKDEDAIREVNRALELDENTPPAYYFFTCYHAHRGAFSEALPFAEKCYLLVPHIRQAAGLLAGLLVRTRDAARAQTILESLGPPTAFGVPRALMAFHLIAGEVEKAADWFERAIEQRDGSVAIDTAYPLYKPLRESPRWPRLAKMMNLPEDV